MYASFVTSKEKVTLLGFFILEALTYLYVLWNIISYIFICIVKYYFLHIHMCCEILFLTYSRVLRNIISYIFMCVVDIILTGQRCITFVYAVEYYFSCIKVCFICLCCISLMMEGCVFNYVQMCRMCFTLPA